MTVENAVLERHVRRLAQLFPELRPVVDRTLEAEPDSVEALLAYCNDYVGTTHDPARETQLRNLLSRLRSALTSDAARDFVTGQIARSDLRSGIPERATILLRDADPGLRSEVERAIDASEAAYGARAGLIRTLSEWAMLEGDVRGRSLIALLEHRVDELRGRSILHVAPEADLRSWLIDRKQELDLEYFTLDAFGDAGIDLKEDLTSLPLADGSFDYVICHRVLEHVLDDGAALREIYRILRPDGALQVSVPLSMHRPTNEWLIADESHHGHVRQCGRDFERRLADAGFRVELDRTLLDRELDEHLAAGTYPMRVYVCRR